MVVPGESFKDSEWEEINAQDQLQQEYGELKDIDAELEEQARRQEMERGRQAMETLNPEAEAAEGEKSEDESAESVEKTA